MKPAYSKASSWNFLSDGYVCKIVCIKRSVESVSLYNIIYVCIKLLFK